MNDGLIKRSHRTILDHHIKFFFPNQLTNERTLHCLAGGSENCLMTLNSVELSHFLDLPTFLGNEAVSESVYIDTGSDYLYNYDYSFQVGRGFCSKSLMMHPLPYEADICQLAEQRDLYNREYDMKTVL